MNLDLKRPLLPGVLLVALVATTLLAGHLFVPEGKSLLFWSIMLLLTLVEATMIFGGLVRLGQREPDGATGVILWTWLGGFFVAFFGFITLKAALRDDMQDGVFAGLILVAVICFVVIFSALSMREQAAQSDEQFRNANREEEEEMARLLRSALNGLHDLDILDFEGKQLRDRLTKQIETCSQALEHAQGILLADAKLRGLCVEVSTMVGETRSTAPEHQEAQLVALQEPVSRLKQNLLNGGIL